MQKVRHTDARLAKISDIPLKPLVASLALPPFSAERRDVGRRRALLQRICGEFDEMPGTCLTLAQATRLFGISPEICDRIFVGLVADGRLRQTPDGRFRLRSAAA